MNLPFDDPDAPLYSVGQVAGMLDVQPAFLRRLDAQELVTPARSAGQQRQYSRHDVRDLQEVIALVGDGLTLEGVRRVLLLQEQVRALEAELAALRAGRGAGGT